jgi:hypothetical protein
MSDITHNGLPNAPIDFTKKKPKKRVTKKSLSASAALAPHEQVVLMETMGGTPIHEAGAKVQLSEKKSVALVHSPRFQNALQEQLARIYPDIEARIADAILSVLQAPMKLEGDPSSVGVKPGDILKAAGMLTDVMGFKAPSVSVAHTLTSTRKIGPQGGE